MPAKRILSFIVLVSLFATTLTLTSCFEAPEAGSNSQKINQEVLFSASRNISHGERELTEGKVEEAQELAFRALEILESNNVPLSTHYGKAWILLGNVAIQIKDYDGAQEYFERAMAQKQIGKLSSKIYKLTQGASAIGSVPVGFVSEKLNKLTTVHEKSEKREMVEYIFQCGDGLGDVYAARGEEKKALDQRKENVVFLKKNQSEPTLSLSIALKKLSLSLSATGSVSEAAKTMNESNIVKHNFQKNSELKKKNAATLYNTLPGLNTSP